MVLVFGEGSFATETSVVQCELIDPCEAILQRLTFVCMSVPGRYIPVWILW